MIVARTISGPTYPEMIIEVDRELTNVIDDFDRGINFEVPRMANETSTLSFSQSVDSRSSGFWYRASRARTSRVRAVIWAF